MSVNQPPHQTVDTRPRTNPNPSTNSNDPGTARWPSRALPAKRQGRVRAAPSRYPCAIHSGRRPQTRNSYVFTPTSSVSVTLPRVKQQETWIADPAGLSEAAEGLCQPASIRSHPLPRSTLRKKVDIEPVTLFTKCAPTKGQGWGCVVAATAVGRRACSLQPAATDPAAVHPAAPGSSRRKSDSETHTQPPRVREPRCQRCGCSNRCTAGVVLTGGPQAARIGPAAARRGRVGER